MSDTEQTTPAPEPAPAPTSAADSSNDERTHALLSWVLMIVVGFLSPLIFLLIDKDKPFVYRHAAMGLSLCILLVPLYILMFVLGFIMAMAGPLVLLMIPLWLAVAAGVIVCIVMGAINGNKGMTFDPPIVKDVCRAIFKV